MSAAELSSASGRMSWLDGARLAAAFCIIGIHTSSDSFGGAFEHAVAHDRVFPILLRSVSEIASTEFFILVSLFLLSMKLSKASTDFIPTMLLQARIIRSLGRILYPW